MRDGWIHDAQTQRKEIMAKKMAHHEKKSKMKEEKHHEEKHKKEHAKDESRHTAVKATHGVHGNARKK